MQATRLAAPRIDERIRPFRIEVGQDVLDDLAQRLARTRWPAAPAGGDDLSASWKGGTSHAYLRELVDYWRTGFDWPARERDLNRFPHSTIALGDTSIHYIHVTSESPYAIPLILTHGYPDSFARFLKLIPLLTNPQDPRDAFDVVVPSLPGYTFSSGPTAKSDLFHVADRWHDLMTALGYERYGAHGGDWGGMVTEHLARSYSHELIGIHLTDVPFWHSLRRPDDASHAEKKYLEQVDQFQKMEGAYAAIQGTRPQSLAVALDDSPAGLAAWLVQFYQRWSDCEGDVEKRFSKDDLLTQVMLYWVTGSIGTSFLPYFSVMNAGALRWIAEQAKQLVGAPKTVPAGFAIFPKELTQPPKEWAQRFFAVSRFTNMPCGGHFAAHEVPELLASDLRDFFRPLRAS
jgi:microsomal epoxide hydrolase|nr:alpha/beta fold hydrolase [Kofleriaceae bacterium]